MKKISLNNNVGAPSAARADEKSKLIDTLIALPASLLGFQTGLEQLQAVFPSRFRFHF